MKVVPKFGLEIVALASVPALTQIPFTVSDEAPPEVRETYAQHEPVV